MCQPGLHCVLLCRRDCSLVEEPPWSSRGGKGSSPLQPDHLEWLKTYKQIACRRLAPRLPEEKTLRAGDRAPRGCWSTQSLCPQSGVDSS